MGMSTGSPNQINVTPLIDVLLVLLIIFLVMIPIMARIEPVALPPNVPDVDPAEPPVVVKLEADLSISVDEAPPMPSAELPTIRKRALAAKQVFVDADSSVPWTEVVSVVDRIRGLAGDDAIQVAVRIHDSAAP